MGFSLKMLRVRRQLLNHLSVSNLNFRYFKAETLHYKFFDLFHTYNVFDLNSNQCKVFGAGLRESLKAFTGDASCL